MTFGDWIEFFPLPNTPSDILTTDFRTNYVPYLNIFRQHELKNLTEFLRSTRELLPNFVLYLLGNRVSVKFLHSEPTFSPSTVCESYTD